MWTKPVSNEYVQQECPIIGYDDGIAGKFATQ